MVIIRDISVVRVPGVGVPGDDLEVLLLGVVAGVVVGLFWLCGRIADRIGDWRDRRDPERVARREALEESRRWYSKRVRLAVRRYGGRDENVWPDGWLVEIDDEIQRGMWPGDDWMDWDRAEARRWMQICDEHGVGEADRWWRQRRPARSSSVPASDATPGGLRVIDYLVLGAVAVAALVALLTVTAMVTRNPWLEEITNYAWIAAGIVALAAGVLAMVVAVGIVVGLWSWVVFAVVRNARCWQLPALN